MAQTGEGFLKLSEEQQRLLRDVYAPKILEWQGKSADAQFTLATQAARQAEESWKRYMGSKEFLGFMEADAKGFLEMTDPEAKTYADKIQKTAFGDLRDTQTKEFKTGLEAVKGEWEKKITEFKGSEVEPKTKAEIAQWVKDQGLMFHPEAGAEGRVFSNGKWIMPSNLPGYDEFDKPGPQYSKAGLEKIEEQRDAALAKYREKTLAGDKKERAGLQEGQELLDWRSTVAKTGERAAVRATSEINASIADQAEASQIEMARMGITPQTSRYFQATRPSTIQAAGLRGAAANTARGAAKGEMLGKAAQMYNVGAGMPAESQNAIRTALAGFGAGGAAYGQGIGQIAQAHNVPLQYANTGIQSMQAGIQGMASGYKGNLQQWEANQGGGSVGGGILGGLLGAAGAILAVPTGGSSLALTGAALAGGASGFASGYGGFR
jgi:hypothetical protein